MRDLDASRTSIWRRRADPALPQNALDFDARPDDVAGGNRWRTWLSAGLTLAPERRMVILEVITRIAFPMMMMFSVYLLMAGHNLPGGGFAGGLVAGLALAVRYLAGGRYELTEAAPVQAGFVLGAGMALAVISGVAARPLRRQRLLPGDARGARAGCWASWNSRRRRCSTSGCTSWWSE
ncbi:MnhB domain-containing protein [Brachybacterium sp. GPGPB12]|uniref:MnhB domain-containing protein n=1 Tax=Brachybacterium sp. GPGPB12 TaxID=3023517 RepID=UPI0031342E16